MTTDHPAGQAGPRILLVEDEPRIRDFICRALSGAGYDADAVPDGSGGLSRALADDYDLVILDLIMPDIDGRTVLAQLLRGRPDQAIMVLSCLDEVTAKVFCLELGAKDYLTKPFSLAELLARVRVQLRAASHRGPRRSGPANSCSTLAGWRQTAATARSR